jgi:Hint module
MCPAMPPPTRPPTPPPTPPPTHHLLVPTPVPPRPTICFSGNNKVETKEKGFITMNELQVGDSVRSGSGKFTQVYGFGHDDHKHQDVFLQIEYNHISDVNGSLSPALQISQMHLLFVERNNQIYLIRVMDVVVGELLSGKQVIAIHKIIQKGVYAPFTQSGDIIVSGIVAFNYVDILPVDNWVWIQHMISHTLSYPQRFFLLLFHGNLSEGRLHSRVWI